VCLNWVQTCSGGRVAEQKSKHPGAANTTASRSLGARPADNQRPSDQQLVSSSLVAAWGARLVVSRTWRAVQPGTASLAKAWILQLRTTAV
jgi:hypothetical protein